MRGAGPHHKQALIAGIRCVTGLTATLDDVPTQGTLDCDLLRNMLQAVGENEHDIRSNLDAIAAESQRFYLANCPGDLRPFLCSGAVEMLAGLYDAGAVLGLVTGNLSAIGWKKVELAGLRRYFQVGGFAEDGETRAAIAKVAFERALEAGVVTTESRVSLIGDHPNDIGAARLNGFQSVGVATGVSTLDEIRAAHAQHAVGNLRELEISILL